MKFFLHTLTRIRIINGALEWQGTPAQFQALESGYPGLPSGAVLRYQTEELQYTETAEGTRSEDLVDCLQYCSAAYLTTPEGSLMGRLQGLLDALDSRLDAIEASGSGSGTPIGAEVIWGFADPPTNWLIENGQTVLRSSAYGTLLVNAGCPFGVGDGSTTVNIPDRRGQFVIGASATYPLFSSGGAAEVTLGVSQIPPHSHYQRFHGKPGGSVSLIWSDADVTASGTSTLLTTETGGGLAHNNLPPYQATEFIVYVGG